MRPFPLVVAFLLAVFVVGAATAIDVLAPPRCVAQDQDAGAHFRRAIEQFNERNYDAALAEFQRAYAIDPAFPVLYNIARVYAGQGNAVESARYYERYLAEGGTHLAADRRQEVQAALAGQRGRIGHLEIMVSADGATITIDGADVATSPMREPLPVTAGTIDLEVRAPNHDVVRRRVRVAGGSVERVVIDLREVVRPGILRIDSHVPDVVVEIDGQAVGETPFDSTINVPAGDHVLVARRPGYRPFEWEFYISRNGQAEVTLEMRPDDFAPPEFMGALVLRLPDASYEARVDGQVVTEAALRALPAGRHRVEVEVGDRLPYGAVVDIRGGGETELAPALEWNLMARQEQVDSAATREALGLGLTIGGVAVGIVGISVGIWNESGVAETDAQIRATKLILEACRGSSSDRCDAAAATEEGLEADRDRQQVIRGVVWGLGIAGVVSTVVGLVLWLGAPDETAIDAAASAQIDVVPLEGGFMLASTVPLD